MQDITKYPEGYQAAIDMVDWLPEDKRQAWLDAMITTMIDVG